MLLMYVRHGEPTYNPDALTPLGHRQAEAVAKRLALFGVDKIYASTSNRAIQTAQPLADITRQEIEPVDWANEGHAWGEFTLTDPESGERLWLFSTEALKRRFTDPEVLALGHKWYEHPMFEGYDYGKSMERVYRDVDAWMLSLGYEHERYTGRYKVVKSNRNRVALFAHQGFGFAFFSCLLDIPYPRFTAHFDMGHTGVTAVEFKEDGGYAVPKVKTLASDSHLYKEGLLFAYRPEFELQF